MSWNVVLYLRSFIINLLTILFRLSTFTFCLFSSDTLQLLMLVCHTILELRFIDCCHPLKKKIILKGLVQCKVFLPNQFNLFEFLGKPSVAACGVNSSKISRLLIKINIWLSSPFLGCFIQVFECFLAIYHFLIKS